MIRTMNKMVFTLCYKTFIMKTYTRKELIEILDIDGMQRLNYSDGKIQAYEDDIELFRGELHEAFMMTLEKYSPRAERIYQFLFKT